MLVGCHQHFEKLLSPAVETLRRADNTMSRHPVITTTTADAPSQKVLRVRIAGSSSNLAWAVEIDTMDDDEINVVDTVSRSGMTAVGPGAERARVQRSWLCAVLAALNMTADDQTLHIRCPAPRRLGLGLAAAQVGREVNFHGCANGNQWRDIMRHIHVAGRRIVVDEWKVKRTDSVSVAAELAEREEQQWTIPFDEDPIPWAGVDQSLPPKFEVLFALAQLRNTSPGEDGIRAEDLKGNHALQHRLVRLVQECWSSGKVPAAFGRAIIVALPKKPGATAWDDHRGITLLAVAGKVLARIIFNRSRSAPLSAMQHGFRQYDSTVDAAFVLVNVMAEARRCGVPLVTTFFDLTKAYDTVSREFLWQTAEGQGLHGRPLELLKAMYEDKISVRVGRTKSKLSFTSTQGVRQGCLLSPLLFNWIFDRVLLEAEAGIQGIPMVDPTGTKRWSAKLLAYADDVAVFSPNMHAAQKDYHVFAEACRKAGMTISIKKTQTLQMDDKLPKPPDPEESSRLLASPPFQTVGGVPFLVFNGSPLPPTTPCPIPGCTATLGGANAAARRATLAAHFDSMHGLALAVVNSQPTLKLKPNLEQVPAPKWRCVSCGDQFKSRAAASRHCIQKEHTTGVPYAGNNRQLFAKISVRQARAEAMMQAGFTTDQPLPPQVDTGEGLLEDVSVFKYLGRMTSRTGDDTVAIKARITAAAQSAAVLLKGPLRQASRATRMEVWRAVIRAQLSYGAETWYISAHNRKVIDRFEMRWLRRVTGLLPTFSATTQVKYPKNADVREAAGVPPLIDIIDRQRLRFIGHVLRRPEDDAVRRSFTDRLPLPGREGATKAHSMAEQMRALMAAADLTEEDASNRFEWREKSDDWLTARWRPATRPSSTSILT